MKNEIFFLIGDHFLDYLLVEGFLLFLFEFVKEDDLILFIEWYVSFKGVLTTWRFKDTTTTAGSFNYSFFAEDPSTF